MIGRIVFQAVLIGYNTLESNTGLTVLREVRTVYELSNIRLSLRASLFSDVVFRSLIAQIELCRFQCLLEMRPFPLENPMNRFILLVLSSVSFGNLGR
jgi:hypothetical protein